MITWCITSKC